MANILIVDDDLDIHALFSVEFKKTQYSLFYAKDDIEAIQVLKEQYIDLIFLDIILGTNQTSQSVVKQSQNKPIILMSAHITDQYRDSILNKGTTILDCVRKPFSKGEMVERVDSILSRDSFQETPVQTETIIGSQEDLGDETSLVKGTKEEDEAVASISGDREDIGEENSLVKGSAEEEKEEVTNISGDKEDLGEEAQLVKGSKEEEDKSVETISGDKEDLGEEAQLVKGSKEEEDKTVEKISGEQENLLEEKQVIKGTSEEDQNVLHLQSSQEDEEEFGTLSLDEPVKESKEEKKYKKDIDFLKKKGPKSRTLEGYTRLMIAVLLGKKIEVELSLDEGEALEDKCKGGYTALHLAVLKGDTAIVDYLLKKGAKLTAKDNENREALYFAIQKGNVEMCQFLIDNGAPVNRRFKGRTYLLQSVLKKNKALFQLFKNSGISPEIRDDHGFNVKHYLKKYKLEHFLKESA